MKKILLLLVIGLFLTSCTFEGPEAWKTVMEIHYLGKTIVIGNKELEIMSFDNWDGQFILSDGREVSDDFVINYFGDSRAELEEEWEDLL